MKVGKSTIECKSKSKSNLIDVVMMFLALVLIPAVFLAAITG